MKGSRIPTILWAIGPLDLGPVWPLAFCRTTRTFTAEQFFRVFAQYNESVWPMQFVLSLLAFTAIVLLYREGRWQGRLISAALSFFWAWMGIVYHFLFFTAINPAAWLFGVIFLGVLQDFGLLVAGVIGLAAVASLLNGVPGNQLALWSLGPGSPKPCVKGRDHHHI